MGRGPGGVERRLKEIFESEPNGVFSTETLCRLVYPGIKSVQKKHRVSVLRAIKNLAGRSMPHLWRKVEKYDRDDVWYDYRSFPIRKKDRAPAIAPRPRKD
jgi:hypothetical protein